VPQRWAADPALSCGSWVGDQWTRKKALDRGEPGQGMTAARAARLAALGFAWSLSSEQISKRMRAASTNESAWEEKLARLVAYKKAHGDCNVPYSWAEDPPLFNWVHLQQHNKNKLDRGEPSKGMTAARAAKLEALGFAWHVQPLGWEAQLAKLKAYKAGHGDCDVPRIWAEDPIQAWKLDQQAAGVQE
jgi:hypothetical protein